MFTYFLVFCSRIYFFAFLFLSLQSSIFSHELSSDFKADKFFPSINNPYKEKLEYKYYLCVAAIFKDEAPYIKEWIEYYKLLGVEHFRLYNNDSVDNYLEVLEPYIREGDVTLVDWPSNSNELGSNYEWVWKTQLPALSDAIAHFSGISKWLAVIDLDEYILPLFDSDLVSFLTDYESFAGVLINWHNFGTSGIWDIPKDQLMIETLTLRAQDQSEYNYPVKSIIRPDRVDLQTKSWCPHTWSYLNNEDKLITPSYQDWKFGIIDSNRIRINHYVHKTERYFWNIKVPNKERMEGRILTKSYIDPWISSCNQVKDTKIFRFVPALRNRIFKKETESVSSEQVTASQSIEETLEK